METEAELVDLAKAPGAKRNEAGKRSLPLFCCCWFIGLLVWCFFVFVCWVTDLKLFLLVFLLKKTKNPKRISFFW